MKTIQLDAPRIGWFHLSEEETARARDFLRRCNTEDAVDELGFGILRDGFSNQFFPGTSTIMTQPRYLLFVPALYRWIERALERSKDAVADPRQRSRQMQDQLRDTLKKTHPERGAGVIGVRTAEPERYPSEIYWAALRTLGIFRHPGMSEGDYLQSLRKHHESSRNEPNGGDPVAEIAAPAPAWDRNFPYLAQGVPIQDEGGRFVGNTSFALEPLEAAYLAERYLRPDTHDKSGVGIDRSLLASLIQRRRKTVFAFPWDVKRPSHLEQDVDDARHFSLLVRGAILQYYFLLIEKRSREGLAVPDADVETWFATWWREGRPQLDEWSLDGFLERRKRDLRSNRNDRIFLETWLRRCRSVRTAGAFLRDEASQALIVQRELTCKPTKARLKHRKHLEAWNRKPDDGGLYQLDFRSRIGAVFVQRIVEGLEGVNSAGVGAS